MSRIKADLHIHSVLSPCGSLDMSPRTIVERALEIGLDLIAVADHNSMANAFHIGPLAQKRGLGFLYALEAQSIEEVHVLGYFATSNQAEAFMADLDPFIPNMPNNPDFFGDQLIVDADDEILGCEERQLISSLNLDIDQLTGLIQAHAGVAVPAHVNADQYGIYRHLGFLPPCLAQGPLEIDYRTPAADVLRLDPTLDPRRFICSSDAHYPRDIGRGQTHFSFCGDRLIEIFTAPHTLFQPHLPSGTAPV
jgi:PHP family Zn ribbon phosphoesterase